MAQTQDSMILNMLKTPQQVREEQLAKLREQSAAQAGLLAQPVQGTTALPGLLSRFAAGEMLAQGEDLNKAARRAAGAAGSALRMAGYDKAAEAVSQSFTSPEERLAVTRQNILKKTDTTNSESMILAARELQAAGDSAGAQALISKAQLMEKNAAETALTRQKALTEITVRLKNMAQAGASNAQMKETLDMLPFKISESEASTLLKQVQATKTSAETDALNAILPFKIDEKIANIALTEARQEQTVADIAETLKQSDAKLSLTQARTIAQAAITEKNKAETAKLVQLLPGEVKAQTADIANTLAKTNLTNEQIATEITMRIPEYLNLQADTKNKIAQSIANDALARKRNVETGAIEAKLPGELALQTAKLSETETKTELNRTQIDINREKLRTMNFTDFMKELDASGLTVTEQQSLIQDRVENTANQGNVALTEVVKGNIKEYSEVVAQGAQAYKGMQLAEKAIRVLPDATTGVGSDARSYVTKLGAQLGFGGDQATAFADTVLKVISGEMTLENAQMLKGTFSDRDIIMIQGMTPSAGWDAASLQYAFESIYIDRYVEYETARLFDHNQGSYDTKGWKNINIVQLKQDAKERYEEDAKERLALIKQSLRQR